MLYLIVLLWSINEGYYSLIPLLFLSFLLLFLLMLLLLLFPICVVFFSYNILPINDLLAITHSLNFLVNVNA